MIDIEKMKALAEKLQKMAVDEYGPLVWHLSKYYESATAIDTLLSELEAREADRRDAERYAFLKRQAKSDPKMNGQHVWYSIPMRNPNGGTLTGNTLDDAIDAALAQRQEGEDDERA